MEDTLEDILKIYYGTPTPEGPGAVTVRFRGSKPISLNHHYRHSPDGFNWGYGGSGPSELSRCLLLNAFGVERCPDFPQLCQCKNDVIERWVEPNYHEYTNEVIANLSQTESWKLDQVEVVNWVFDHREHPTPVPV